MDTKAVKLRIINAGEKAVEELINVTKWIVTGKLT